MQSPLPAEKRCYGSVTEVTALPKKLCSDWTGCGFWGLSLRNPTEATGIFTLALKSNAGHPRGALLQCHFSLLKISWEVVCKSQP